MKKIKSCCDIHNKNKCGVVNGDGRVWRCCNACEEPVKKAGEQE